MVDVIGIQLVGQKKISVAQIQKERETLRVSNQLSFKVNLNVLLIGVMP